MKVLELLSCGGAGDAGWQGKKGAFPCKGTPLAGTVRQAHARAYRNGVREHAQKSIRACQAAAVYSPALARRAAALSVRSQVNSGSSRPKWP